MRGEVHRVPLEGQKIALVLHLPERTPAPCVVACHGLGASKDGDKYLLLGRELPSAGFALARFDFRGCGESDGKYRDTTVGSRVEDLGRVLQFLRGHPHLDGRFGLLGSSMGGYVALWVAAEVSFALPVVTWNTPATLRGLERRRSDDVAALGPAFFEELDAGRYVDSPAGIRFCLVLQAERDETVPPEHGRILFERAAEPRKLYIIPAADHRLSDPAHRMEAVRGSRDWLRRFLLEAG